MKRTERNTYQLQLLATLLLLITAFVLSACSSDDTNTTPATTPDSEIRFNPEVWKMLEGTRATTFNSASDLQSEGFMCAVYNANEITEYISALNVNWDGDSWEFAGGKRYWPASGSLDFFAYSPTTIPSYITDMSDVASNVTYVARNPQFKCKGLPMIYTSAYTDDKSVDHPAEGQTSGLQEFIWALTTGQNKEGQGASGVTMTFKHPFACIKFQLSDSHPDITINSITFKNLKSGGTCSFNGSTSTWSAFTPADKTVDFVMTLKGAESLFNGNPSSPLPQIGPTILMVPQTFGGEVVVNATWTDWGDQLAHTVTTTIPSVTWKAGYSYTYTFTITETDLIVDTTKFTEQW